MSAELRYEGRVFRPPSEHDALIAQATIGCSWNHCTYCDMYRDKQFRARPVADTLRDLDLAASQYAVHVRKLFLADGDALVLATDTLLTILARARERFPHLERVSCYAMARNVAAKSPEELRALQDAGLTRLYIGPESGDDVVLKRIAKGDTFAGHVSAAEKAHGAGMELSVIALLGIAMERSSQHARATAELVTAMDPAFFSALTVTVVPGTPLATLSERGSFKVPGVPDLLRELREMVSLARPTSALFRTNHASNYLPLGGTLPRDAERICATIDAALAGRIPLRREAQRGL